MISLVIQENPPGWEARLKAEYLDAAAKLETAVAEVQCEGASREGKNHEYRFLIHTQNQNRMFVHNFSFLRTRSHLSLVFYVKLPITSSVLLENPNMNLSSSMRLSKKKEAKITANSRSALISKLTL